MAFKGGAHLHSKHLRLVEGQRLEDLHTFPAILVYIECPGQPWLQCEMLSKNTKQNKKIQKRWQEALIFVWHLQDGTEGNGTKPDDWSQIPETHVVEGENWLLKTVL